MQLNILKHQLKELGSRLSVKKLVRKIYSFLILLFLTNCNTVTGTVEGTVRGVIKDVKTTHHYTTCIFTKTQCGDLDLE